MTNAPVHPEFGYNAPLDWTPTPVDADEWLPEDEDSFTEEVPASDELDTEPESGQSQDTSNDDAKDDTPDTPDTPEPPEPPEGFVEEPESEDESDDKESEVTDAVSGPPAE